MPDLILINIIYILFSATAVLFGMLSFIFYLKTSYRNKITGSLKFVLYEMSFINDDTPRENEQKEKGLKELISKMEQFLSGVASLKGDKGGFLKRKNPYFVLELAVKGIGEEVIFYAAVPKNESRLFEKQFESFFPGSSLRVKENDYNIFNPEGSHAASYAALRDSPILPIKTYQDLDSDPLESILNSFSKIKEEGEGAAFQLIIKKSDGGFSKKLKSALSALRSGATINEAKRKKIPLFGFLEDDFGPPRVLTGIIGNGPEVKEKPLAKIHEEAVKLIEKKISREMMAVNFRLIASASRKEEAEILLNELESSFSQFNDPQSNGFKFAGIKGRKLKNIFTDFSFRIFNEKQTIYLNTSEITSIFHFPVKLTYVPHLKTLKSKLAPAPFDTPKEGMFLGINSFRGKDTEIRMLTEDRRRHMYIVGQTGTGKSTLMENMAVLDIKNGAGVCVIDPHGSLVDGILSRVPKERMDDVIYFDPSNIARPMGLNMLEYDVSHPEQKTFIANEVYDVFRKLWKDVPEAFGPMFEQYYRNSTLLVLEDPESGNTFLEIIRVLSDKSFRDYKLSRTDNPILKSFWKNIAEKAGGDSALQNIVPYVSSKFDTFLNNEIMRPILIQEKSSFNFREIMDSGKILLINLSKGKLGDINAYLLGLIVVGKILMAALSRVDIADENKRADFYLYLDEFQNVTTKSIATILSEARKYRLNLVLAHQFIGQLEEDIKKAIFGNVGSMFVYRIGAEDAEFLEKYFLPVFNRQDLINIDNLNAYAKLLINSQTAKPFNISIKWGARGEEEYTKSLKELSALKYGRPREEVEAEIREKYNNN